MPPNSRTIEEEGACIESFRLVEDGIFQDDGSPIKLALTIDRSDGSAVFDFAGTGPEIWGNCNAPSAVTGSAVLYSLRCLIEKDLPLNDGCLIPITLHIPPGSLLDPSIDAAVVGGHVLTSQRVVDVVLKAFGVAAASQGCMNNFTFGNDRFGYYETIGGGDGLVREVEFLEPMNMAILSERRVFAPYGLEGGEPGKRGKNIFTHKDGRQLYLGGKNEILAQPGDRFRIMTPGGGGFGKKGTDS